MDVISLKEALLDTDWSSMQQSYSQFYDLAVMLLYTFHFLASFTSPKFLFLNLKKA